MSHDVSRRQLTCKSMHPSELLVCNANALTQDKNVQRYTLSV